MTSSSEESNNLTVKEEPFDDLSWNRQSQTRGSAFSPYKPGTVLTNLQRGNVETTQKLQDFPEEFTLYSRAAMGELIPDDFIPEIDVDEKDGQGFTYVMWAAFYGQLPTVQLLLNNHCIVDIQGLNGETALVLAASGGHHEIVSLLLSAGANPNHEDNLGNTAIMYAANGDHAHCVSELLENGALLNYANSNNITAYKLAVAKGNKRAQIVMERYLLRVMEPS